MLDNRLFPMHDAERIMRQYLAEQLNASSSYEDSARIKDLENQLDDVILQIESAAFDAGVSGLRKALGVY